MAFTLTRSRVRSDRPRSVVRSAGVLLAVLFILLRPVCDVFAASGEGHGAAATPQGYVQLSDAVAGGHAGDEICCSSIDGDALTVPASPPLPAAFTGDLAAPSGAILHIFTSVAKPFTVAARRDPAPPRSYHARSLRRLD